MNTNRVAIYSRISTDKQDSTNQLTDLRDFAQRQGWSVVFEFVDTATGGTADREQFQLMFQAAERHEFDTLLFWSTDRLTREGTLETLQHLRRLEQAGVGFRSFTEQYLDSTGIMKDVVLALLATMAKQEKVRISERTKAGLMVARSRGVKLGRPARIFDVQKASRMLSEGLSKRQVSRNLNIPLSTLLDRIEAI